jgi:hypothetical protein
MRKPNKTLRALGVGRMNVKSNAHAWTLFAVFWSFFSGFVILALLLAYHDRSSSFTFTPATIGRLCAAVVVLAIYLWSIIAAIYYWRTERKRKVTVLHIIGEVSADL